MKKRLQADDCSPLILASRRGEVKLVSYARDQYPGRPLQSHQLPGLRTIGYWDGAGAQTWGLPMHRNEGIEICFLLSGEVYFATDSEQRMLRPGDITITRPWQRHCLGNPNIRACKLFWFILDVESGSGRASWEFPGWIGPDAESRRRLLRVLRKNQKCLIRESSKDLRGYMRSACSRLEQDSGLTAAWISSIINHLLLKVVERLSGELGEGEDDPQGFDRTIREFFYGLETSCDKAAEPWSVADIAHICRVGVTYLTKSCREIFNTTPSEQLSKTRLAHAARLLEERNDLSVTDIAMRVGFNTSQYFATRFRKEFGEAPQGYRRNGRNLSRDRPRSRDE